MRSFTAQATPPVFLSCNVVSIIGWPNMLPRGEDRRCVVSMLIPPELLMFARIDRRDAFLANSSLSQRS